MANEQLTMPYNRDAEMALLGCILMDAEIAADIVEKLSAADFYVESHQVIIRAMNEVFTQRKPIDLVTVSDQLDAKGELTKAGGIAYLTELAQITPSAANYKSYLEIVLRDSTNRKLIRAARKIIETSLKSVDGNESMAYAEKLVYDISKQSDRSTLAPMSDGDIVGQVIHKFEQLQNDPDSFKGIPTGYKRLDQMMNGLQKTDLLVLAARPGMGKTSFAMNLVENAGINHGKTCAVFSLEMPRQQIVQRLLCSYAKVHMGKALRGQLTQEEWKKIILASDKLRKSKIYVDDSSSVTPAEILSKCRRLKSIAGSLDLVMIDYIQLMRGGSSTVAGSENRQQEIASITRDLKIMAKELEVPIIALSQLRRIQSNEPTLSDLRESGAIEQDADIVMFIHRPEALATAQDIAAGRVVKGAADLIIAKHRNGEQGRVPLKFIGEYTKFVDVDSQGAMDEPPQYGRPQQPQNFENEDPTSAFNGDDGPSAPPYGGYEDDEVPFE
ncbi:MAG: replicative DNA helicase [Clostridia bacterium]|nr:replicative DNA helicase [Clostridia bacterium]